MRVLGSVCSKVQQALSQATIAAAGVGPTSAGRAASLVQTWIPGHTELNDGTKARATSLSSAGVPPPLALASWEPGRRVTAGLHFS